MVTPLCSGNISKDWSVDNMKKNGFNAYVCDFSVDYYAIAVNDILDIHKYLMKTNNMIQKCLNLLKKCLNRINSFVIRKSVKNKSIECNSVELYFNDK